MPEHARWMLERAKDHLLQSADTKRRIAETGLDPVVDAAVLIADAFRAGKKLLLCGNGGSAADCQHLAAEFVSSFSRDLTRPGLPAIALTTDTSCLTAYTNDFGFEGVFARQVEALGRPGDVLIGISTSGNSANVVLAVDRAKAMGLRTLVLTGPGGRLAGTADVAISVPSGQTPHIQESHITLGHILCDLVEGLLFRGKTGGER